MLETLTLKQYLVREHFCLSHRFWSVVVKKWRQFPWSLATKVFFLFCFDWRSINYIPVDQFKLFNRASKQCWIDSDSIWSCLWMWSFASVWRTCASQICTVWLEGNFETLDLASGSSPPPQSSEAACLFTVHFWDLIAIAAAIDLRPGVGHRSPAVP